MSYETQPSNIRKELDRERRRTVQAYLLIAVVATAVITVLAAHYYLSGQYIMKEPKVSYAESKEELHEIAVQYQAVAGGEGRGEIQINGVSLIFEEAKKCDIIGL